MDSALAVVNSNPPVPWIPHIFGFDLLWHELPPLPVEPRTELLRRGTARTRLRVVCLRGAADRGVGPWVGVGGRVEEREVGWRRQWRQLADLLALAFRRRSGARWRSTDSALAGYPTRALNLPRTFGPRPPPPFCDERRTCRVELSLYSHWVSPSSRRVVARRAGGLRRPRRWSLNLSQRVPHLLGLELELHHLLLLTPEQRHEGECGARMGGCAMAQWRRAGQEQDR